MCLAVPGKVVSVLEEEGLNFRRGKVDFGGVYREACLAYVPEAKVGDYTVIHVGFAISLLREEEAQSSLTSLQEIANLQEEMGLNREAT